MQKRYVRACDRKSYSLKNRSPVPTAEGTRLTRKLTAYFKCFVDHRFTGSNPAFILCFLELFARRADYISFSEVYAEWLIADYIDTTPNEMVFGTTSTADYNSTEFTYIRIFRELLFSLRHRKCST